MFIPLGLILGSALHNPALGVGFGTLLMAVATTISARRAGRRISPVVPIGLVVCAVALMTAGLVSAGIINVGR